MKRIFTLLNKSSIVTSIFIILSLIILTVTILNYNKRKSEIIHNINTELKAIAELKASEVSTWINERVSDSKVLTQGYFLSNRLNDYFRYKKNDDYLNIYEKATAVKKYYKYEDVFILDSNNNIILTTNQRIEEFSLETKKAIDELKRSGINFKVYQCNYCKKVHLDFLSPIFNSNSKLIGYALLRTNPHDYLFPLISRWPTQSNTAETIIVRREGDSVLFINDVRHRNNAALKIKVPITRTDVVAAKVVLGAMGLIEGHDYRDMDVLAYALPIENSNWAMIAKIDQEEVYRPIKRLYITYGTILSLLFLFLATIVFLIRNTYQKSYIKKLYDNELEKKALVSHYKYLIKNANDIILLANRNGDILEANDAAIKAYQIPLEKVKDTHLNNLGYFKLFTDKKNNGVYETTHSRLNGTKFPVEINEQYINIDGEVFYQAIIRDITERIKAEKILNETEARFSTLFQLNPSPIGITRDYDFRIVDVNDAWCEMTGYSRGDVIDKNTSELKLTNAETIFQIREEIKDYKKITNQEISILTKSGQIRNVVMFSDRIETEGEVFFINSFLDITERKQSEEKLLESEKRYTTLFQKSNVPVFLLKLPDVVIFDVNEAAEKLLGYKKDELIGKNAAEVGLISNKQRTTAISEYNRENSLTDKEMRMISKSGEEFVVLFNTHPVEINGQPFAFTSFVNITDRKIAEAKLETSQNTLKLFIEYAPASIAMFDKNMRYLAASRKFLSDYNIKDSNIIGKTHYEVFPEISDDWKTIHKKCLEGFVEKCDADPFPRVDGTLDWVHWEIHPWYERTGEVGGLLLFSELITDRVNTYEKLAKSEQRFSQVAEQSQTVIWEVDAEGLYTYVSPLASSIWGYTPDELIGKKHYYDLHPAEGREEFKRVTLQAIGRHEKFNDLINPIETPAGNTIWVMTSGTPVYNKDNEFIGYIGSDNDITAEKQANEALVESELFARSTLNGLSAHIAIVDSTGKIIAVNNAWRNFAENNSPLLSNVNEGANYLEACDKASGEDELIAKQAGTALREILLGKEEIVEIEYACHSPKEQRWFIARISRFPGDGSPKAVIAHENITELKKVENALIQSEETHRILFEHNPIPMWVYELETLKFLRVNEVASEKYGYTMDEFLGMTLKDIRPEEEAQHLINNVKNIGNERIQKSGAWKHKLKGGEIILVEIHSHSLTYERKNARLVAAYDITERVMSERSLRESEIKFRKLYEEGPFGMVMMGSDFKFKMTNNTFCQIVGYDEEELLNLSFKDITHPDDIEEDFSNVLKLIRGEIPVYKKQKRYIRKDKTQVWVALTVTANFNHEGNFLYCVAIVEDITEQRKAAEIVRTSEIVHRQLFENNPVPIAITTVKDGRFYMINDAYTQQMGYTANDLIGEKVSDFNIYVNPDDRQLVINTLKEQGGFKNLEIQFRTKFGDLVLFELSMTTIQVNGEDCILSAFRNITERKLAEEKIRELNRRINLAAQSASIGIWDWNIVKNELVWDDRMFALYGIMSSKGKFPYEVWLKGLHPDDREISDEMSKRAVLGEIEYDTEFRVVWPDGSIHWLKAYGQVLYDENRNPIRMIGVNYDITKRKQIEKEILDLNANLESKIKDRTVELAEINDALKEEIEERKSIEHALKDARQEAEKANIAKSEFLSRMSHELRTPMNSILGFAQLLEMGELNPNQKKGVNHIMKSGKHLLDLINEVLDISRIEAGRISLSLEPVQLQSVISETIDIVKPLANEKNISVELHDPHICDLYIRADRQRVKQILINLINNGIKYNNNGGYVKVTCSLLFDESKIDQFVRISVVDNGYGISEENKINLFTPFERAGAEKTTIEGTGLGLAVARKLVEAMGGNLGVESKINEGSTFWIEFPQCESQLEVLAEHERLDTGDSSISTKKGTILYVEDNIPNIELIEQVLDAKFKSIKLVTTRFGKEAVSLAIEHKPNLILLDLNLPDIHGSEVFEQLKTNSHTTQIPVVVISADAMQSQLDRLLSAGVKQYLTKPLDIQEFLRVIIKYVNL